MRLLRRLALPALLLLAPALLAAAPDPLAWPTPTNEMRPWTRWWWLGNAVDQPDLTRELTQFQAAGLGGVEICPIYGAHGSENKFIPFLSPEWLALLAHTTTEAQRLDLGVDLTTGTGWPPGGPFVSAADASTGIILKRFEVAGGGRLADALPAGRVQCVLAVSDQNEKVDLTTQVHDGQLDWTAPAGTWRLYVAVESGPVQKVKRAAPGGEGDVLDPFSPRAMGDYLGVFDRAFAGYQGLPPRAQFIDSYEYYGADWTPDFFKEFAARRGYDLRQELPALLGDGPADTVARVKYDYRATAASLHSAYTRVWTDWAHRHGSLTRLQAHGSPTDLVDVYADADIPETEIFGSLADSTVVMNKMSSSAAHLKGGRLASAESFTWLNEPFQATLSQVKQAADYLFLTGVNLIVYQGIPYSPAEAPWPGWQFYAAVNFGPDGGLWRDLPEFNAYATRCQSLLQAGAPANDVLLYFPIHDVWQAPAGMLIPLTVHEVRQTLGNQPFYATAATLWDHGFGYDIVTDHFLGVAKAGDHAVTVDGNRWKVVLVPAAHLMPVATLRQLIELARGGATILVQGELPADVPGLKELEDRRTQFKEALAALNLVPTADAGVERAAVGEGAILVGADPLALLHAAGVAGEPCTALGLRFVRRAEPDGYTYFLANRGAQPVDGWVAFATPAQAAAILDPMYPDRAGLAAVRPAPGGFEAYLQLAPGESRLLRTFDHPVTAPAWPYRETAGGAQPVTGTWHVQFVDGGPVLPAAYDTPQLASWTTRDDPELKRFAGTASYTIAFDRPAGAADDWLLDLGAVDVSARVKLNGHEIDAFWSAPYRAPVGRWLQPGRNTLEVEVTNLAANRIRDLDVRQVKWKYFYDINVVGRNYRPLDASQWPLFDSGLLGPVTLTPLKALTP
ncbi:MAG TPA: glycosyl hydrolase [Opitutaceae bacterium]|nr:glycosyl hydrolase [Opitutaceae bacterium]